MTQIVGQEICNARVNSLNKKLGELTFLSVKQIVVVGKRAFLGFGFLETRRRTKQEEFGLWTLARMVVNKTAKVGESLVRVMPIISGKTLQKRTFHFQNMYASNNVSVLQ